MIKLRLAAISLLSLVLVACGGGGSGGGVSNGGGGTTNPLPPSSSQQSQSIAFAQPGPVSVTLSDGTYQDVASGGAGTGAITYQSSDPRVSTVDANTGTVTLVAVGTVQITATKAADASYLSATASYTLTVSASSGASFAASIGSQDSQVVFSSAAAGMSFLRSTQADCDITQFSTCANSQVDTVGAMAITDTSATLTTSAFYWLGRGSTFRSSPTLISLPKFLARSAPQMTSFNGKLWMVGGQQTDIALTSDVWSSSDGIAWIQVNPGAPFAVRAQGQLVAFNNRLWLIGGNGAGPYVKDVWRNDVWSTADGVTWRQDTAAAAFSGRFGHSAFAFNGKMWVIGGGVGSGSVGGGNDIWSSADGVNWTQMTNAAPFGSRFDSTVTEFNNSLWLIGTRLGGTQTEVWNSTDGINWSQVTMIAGPARVGHAAGVVNNRLVIAGGTSGTNAYLNDVWTSADGTHWTQASGPSPFIPRKQMGYATLNGKLFIAGGEYAPTVTPPPLGPSLVLFFGGDVWSTSDAASWTQMTPYAPLFPGSYNVQALNGKLWIIGGYDGVKSRNEVWSSSDGAHWGQATTSGIFDARSGPGTVTFNSRLWVVGGVSDDGGTEFTDVWSSADGSTWMNATNSAAFGRRHGEAVVNAGSQLYVLGGIHNGTYLNDVWTSSDGVSWSQVTVSTPFPARANAVAASFNGRLWVLGGSDSNGQRSDVWSSADGANWQVVSNSVPALANKGVSLTVHGGKLWLTGGDQPGYVNFIPSEIYSNAVWSSDDGITWTQVDAAAPYSGRSNAAMVEFNNQLWVIGGHDAYSPRNDAWFSPDGVNWRVMYSGTIASP